MWLFLWFGRHLDFSTAFHTANFNPVNYLEENSMQPKNCSKFTPNTEHIMDVMIHYSQTSRRSCKKFRIKQRNMDTIIIIYQIYLLELYLFYFVFFYKCTIIIHKCMLYIHTHICAHAHTYTHKSENATLPKAWNEVYLCYSLLLMLTLIHSYSSSISFLSLHSDNIYGISSCHKSWDWTFNGMEMKCDLGWI